MVIQYIYLRNDYFLTNFQRVMPITKPQTRFRFDAKLDWLHVLSTLHVGIICY
jgi:hypothetical protein